MSAALSTFISVNLPIERCLDCFGVSPLALNAWARMEFGMGDDPHCGRWDDRHVVIALISVNVLIRLLSGGLESASRVMRAIPWSLRRG